LQFAQAEFGEGLEEIHRTPIGENGLAT
jgi:hypothetical protein